MARYRRHDVGPRLCYYRPPSASKESTFAEEVSRSLDHTPRSLNPKFFYNRTGSMLFDMICKLPEYYLTRSEISILGRMQESLPEYLPHRYRLVELGSGSAVKTRLILDVLDRRQDRLEFFPIDVSDILGKSSLDLLEAYPNLYITGVIDTFESGLEFIGRQDRGPDLFAFLGSSLGNFEPRGAQELLGRVSETMGGRDLFLLGLDMVKDRSILERAYDDSQNVTARFNLNILRRINDELGGDFAVDGFEHHSVFNPEYNRIEMYLRSRRDQSVRIPRSNLSIRLGEGELIHTEYSHKYTMSGISGMMDRAGLDILHTWRDPEFDYRVILAARS